MDFWIHLLIIPSIQPKIISYVTATLCHLTIFGFLMSNHTWAVESSDNLCVTSRRTSLSWRRCCMVTTSRPGSGGRLIFRWKCTSGVGAVSFCPCSEGPASVNRCVPLCVWIAPHILPGSVMTTCILFYSLAAQPDEPTDLNYCLFFREFWDVLPFIIWHAL